MAVDDHEFTVIAKVKLKTIAPSTGGLEPLDAHATLAQGAQPLSWQLTATDFIVEKIDLDAYSRPLHQPLLQFPAERVVMHNEELHQQVIARRVDRREKGLKSRVTIEQQI